MTRQFRVNDKLVREVEELREANARLLEALRSRVVIEQAKGRVGGAVWRHRRDRV